MYTLIVLKENFLTGLLISFIFLLCSEVWHFIRKEHVSIFWRSMILLLGIYFTNLFSITISPIQTWSLSFFGSNTNFIPFKALTMANSLNLWGNILLFIPLGLLLVMSSKQCQKLIHTLLLGFSLSIFIEFLQLFSYRATDIDDIILNTLGTMLGYFLGKLLLFCIPALNRRIGISRKKEQKFYKRKRDSGATFCLSLFTLLALLITDFTEYTVDANRSKSSIHMPETITQTSYTVKSNITLSQKLRANYCYLIDTNTNHILYQKNENSKLAPASTTKLLTALTVLDYCNTEETVTVGDELNFVAADASRAWLKQGDTLTIEHLLTALLLPSGNDAAYTLAAYTGRMIDNTPSLSTTKAVQIFIEAMNRKAAAIGAKSSQFMSPDGYDSDMQYSTAHDLALIAKAFIEHEVLYGISGRQQSYDTWIDGQEVTYKNTNQLLLPESPYYHPQVTGLKTGSSDTAGYCLISSALIDRHTYICVVMDSSEEGRWSDSLKLYAEIQK